MELLQDEVVQDKMEEAAKLFYSNNAVTVNLTAIVAAGLLFLLCKYSFSAQVENDWSIKWFHNEVEDLLYCKDMSLFKLLNRLLREPHFHLQAIFNILIDIRFDRKLAKFGNCSAYKSTLGLFWELVCSLCLT